MGHVTILGRINSRTFGYKYYFRLHGELPKPCPSDTCGTLRETLIPMKQNLDFVRIHIFPQEVIQNWGCMKTRTEGMRR